MKNLNKRKIILIIISALIFVSGVIAFFVFRDKISKGNEREQTEKFDYAVSFVDVGEGDCMLARFPDGKILMIDCGIRNDKVYGKIDKELKRFDAKKIDYLIITHPDADHAGNALTLAKNYKIENAYVPDIMEHLMVFYGQYAEFYSYIKNNGTEIITNHYYRTIKGDNYFLAFLTPTPKAISGSEYIDFNGSVAPTEELSNVLSPIIYMEICGVRFVLTGDAPAKQEKVALENLKTFLQVNFEYELGRKISLESVDYLKVSHHGSDDASCMEFLTVVCPKNAIISVGGDNNYGHPADSVLTRLAEVNPLYNLFRTDVNGTITVKSIDGRVLTSVQFDK